MPVLISVIMTVYNRERYLAAAIASVLGQTNSNFELLVWDDGSADSSLEIARYYEQRDWRVRVVAAAHQGRTLSLKAAIAQTQGKYVGLVDSDDLLAARALQETATVLEQNPQVGLVYTDYWDIDERNKFLGLGHRCQIPYSQDRLLLDFMTFHFRLMRRSVYEEVGGFDEAMEYAEDYDLCLKLSEVTEVEHLKKPLYFYRNHQSSICYQYSVEQAYISCKAIERAIRRRGLANQVEVSLQVLNLLPFKTIIKLAFKRGCSVFLAATSLTGNLTPFLPAAAQSITPAQDGTNTRVNTNGNRIDITGGTLSKDGANLFHSFSQFGLNQNQTANFLSTPAIQNILGRITGGNASVINGTIQVTGGNSNLFLLNPSGFVFGANAQLNVPASFTATTANGIGFGNNWFNATGSNNYIDLVGTPSAFTFSTSQPGVIVNAGQLSVNPGQDLNLLGGTVVNTGTITAPGGNITIAAVPGSSMVRISQPGHLLSLEITPLSPSLPLPPSPTPPSLPELLTGPGAGTATKLSVNSNGQVVLTGSGTPIPTDTGTTIVAGSLNTSNPQSGQPGGTVHVLGQQVGLVDKASINASGDTGGGTVLIGGDYRGGGSVPHANATFIGPEVNITADALTNGNGGKVIVWSDQATRTYGTITARGGAISGNGGFIETSSKGYLEVTRPADASATNGLPGTWLLDPSNITIINGSSGNGTIDTSVPNFNVTSGNPQNSTITNGVINTALNSGSNVTISTSNPSGNQIGDIVQQAGAAIGGGYFLSVPTLTLQAANNITLNDSITGTNNGINVVLQGEGGGRANSISVNAPISTGGGNFTSTSNNFNSSGTNISTGGGSINLDATNNITAGNIDTGGGSFTSTSLNFASNGANITTGGLDININATNNISTGDLTTNGGNINLNATNNITTGNINTTNVEGGGNFNSTSTNGSFNSSGANITTGSGSVNLSATNNNITIGNVDTGGGSFNSTSLNFSSNGANITTSGADINITGTNNITTGNLTTTANTAGQILLTTNGGGNITIGGNLNATGGGDGGGGNNIVLTGNVLLSNDTTLTTGRLTGGFTDGNITITGTVNGTANLTLDAGTAGNITFGNTVGNTTPIGNLTVSNASITNLNGNVTTTSNSNISFNSNVTLNSDTVLTADQINFLAGNGSVTGNNHNLTLQPATSTRNIQINGTTNPNALTLTQGDIGALNSFSGFGSLTIGGTNSSGTITLASNTTFVNSGPVTIQAPVGAGSINTTGFTLTGIGRPLTLLASQDITTGNITNQGANLTITSSNGNITTTGNLVTSSSFSSAGPITLTSGNGRIITIGGNLDASGNGYGGNNITLAGNVLLSNDATLNTVGSNGFNVTTPANGNVNITGAVDGTGVGGQNLTVIAGTGNVTFGNAVGNTTPLGNLTVSIANTTNLNGNVTTTSNSNISFNSAVALNSDTTLTADDIDFTGNVTGVGFRLGLQPATATTDIRLGDTTTVAGNLNLTAAKLGRLQNGFSGITIGRSDGSGTINVVNPITFQDPVTLQSPTGQINVNGQITGIDNASVTLNGTTTLNNNISTADQNLTINGNVLVGSNSTLNTVATAGSNILLNGTVNGSNGLTVNAGTGNITFTGAVGNTQALGNLQANSTGTTLFNSNVNAASLTTDAGGTTQLGGNVITTGVQNYGDNIQLNGNLTLASNNNNVSFSGNLNSQPGTTNALTVNAGTGNITFTGAVGNTQALGNLQANSTGTTLFNSSVNATSLTTDAGGTTQLGGNVSTTGVQNYGDDVQLNGNLTLASNNNNVSFGGNVNSQPGTTNALTVNAGTGNITFTGAVGNTQAVGNLQANSTGTTLFNNSVNAASLTTDAGGTTQLGGNVTTTGVQNYGDDVQLNGNVTLASNNNNVSFGGNVNSQPGTANALTVNAGTGNIIFNAVGNSTPLGNLTIAAANNVTAGAITASGITQTTGTGTTTFNGSLNTNSATGINLQGTNFVFNGPVTTTNSGDVSIKNSGTLTINSGADFNLAGALNQTGTGAVSLASNITTNNQDISFSGPVTLNGDVGFNLGTGTLTFGFLTAGSHPLTLQAGEINFVGGANSVTGNSTITLQPAVSSQNVTLGGAEGTSALDLTATDIAALGQGFNSITIGRSDGTGTISLANNVTFQAPVTIQAPVGAGTIVGSGNITGSGNASITLTANQDVATGNLTANGGLNITSKTGSVTTGDLIAKGVNSGGAITVSAQNRITTGVIDSSASVGNGGNVTLDPQNDVQVVSINAQGGTTGRGGTVDITTQRFFRATGTFSDQTGRQSSIATTGGSGSGAITIRHGGGYVGTSFDVGNGQTNGTAGAITSSAANSIEPFRSFPGSYTQGNIRILTKDPTNLPDPEKVRRIPASEIPVYTNLSQLAVDKGIANIENRFTTSFENYFGGTGEATLTFKSQAQAHDILQAIESSTGVKPALIYVSFVPQTLATTGRKDADKNPDDRLLPPHPLVNQDNDQLELVVVTAKGNPIRVRVPGTTRAAVLKVAQEFRASVTNIRSDTDYLKSAQQMYRWIVTPIEQDLHKRGIQNLVFLMDTGLRSLPIAALHDGKGFVVEKYSVGLMPSLSLTDTHYKNIKSAQVLAMGADHFTNQNPLPSVSTELDVITKQLWTGKSFINQAFTLNNLKAQRQKTPFGIVHLATHGEFKPGAPSNSYIQLWDTQLRLDQLRQLGWSNPPVELVVLSACRTALGDTDAELGFAGFAAQAGVKSALGSLWYVSDEGTLGLMTEFYQQLKKAPIKAQALRQAQVDMLKGDVRLVNGKLHTPNEDIPLPPELVELGDKDLKHPYYWAAFTMIGNPW